jgi:preprotein translocase subunit SecG
VGALNIVLVVLWAISAVTSILFVLMHSGKGTGVSDMIAASMYSANGGSGVWEKNLDRLTYVSVAVFAITLFAFMLTFPQGTM